VIKPTVSWVLIVLTEDSHYWNFLNCLSYVHNFVWFKLPTFVVAIFSYWRLKTTIILITFFYFSVLSYDFVLMDVNCCWSLNRWGYMTCCFTRFPQTIAASVIMCPKSKKPLIVICVYCVGRVWWQGFNYRWVVRLCGCIAWRRWHLTLSSSFVTYYVYRSNILLSVTQIHSKPFYSHFSLCTEMVQKQCCTKVVQAELSRSSCTEIGLYQSRPPPCPEWSYTDLVLPQRRNRMMQGQ